MRWVLLLAGLLGALAPSAAGHPTFPTSAVVTVHPDGTMDIAVRHDVLAFALNDSSANVTDPPMYALLNGPDESLTAAFDAARARFERLFVLEVDGQRVPVAVTSFPSTTAIRQWQREFPDRRLPVKMDIEARAHLSSGPHRFSVRFPDVLAETVVTIDRPGEEPVALPLGAGERSPVFAVAIGGADQAAPEHEPPPATEGRRQLGVGEVLWRYARLGFTHIVPGGPDHMLFVLGLFLLVPRMKTVLWQITAFTMAHTVTLTLASLHLVNVGPRIVEPTIAATIAFIGVENLLTKRVHPWRIAVAFLFGLVHGLGVATAFNEAGFPTGQLVPSLGAFTLGVEGGHIIVLAAAFAALGWCRDKPWYRSRVAVPLSILISLIAAYWMVARLM